jgi:hypothetical protein
VLLLATNQAACGEETIDLENPFVATVNCSSTSPCETREIRVTPGVSFAITTYSSGYTDSSLEKPDTVFNIKTKPYWMKTKYNLFGYPTTDETKTYIITASSKKHCSNIPRTITLTEGTNKLSLHSPQDCE